jgi:hypothetical protein
MEFPKIYRNTGSHFRRRKNGDAGKLYEIVFVEGENVSDVVNVHRGYDACIVGKFRCYFVADDNDSPLQIDSGVSALMENILSKRSRWESASSALIPSPFFSTGRRERAQNS